VAKTGLLGVTETEERKRIHKAVASLQKSVGQRPLGWYCRYSPSINTRRLLVEEGGFLYDSDCYNDELPYWTKVVGRSHLVVPYTLGVNDSKYPRGIFATSQDFFTYAKDSVDQLLSEGIRYPKMMSVGMHMRITGHPGRAAGIARLLEGEQVVLEPEGLRRKNQRRTHEIDAAIAPHHQHDPRIDPEYAIGDAVPIPLIDVKGGNSRAARGVNEVKNSRSAFSTV